MTAVRKGADFFLFQLMLLLCAIWGSQQVAIKLAAEDIAPMLQVALRSGIAAVLVGILLLWQRGWRGWLGSTWLAGILAGVLFALEFFFIALGLRYTSASHMAVFLYTAPIFSALGLHLMLPSERLRRLQWLGIALCFGGVVMAFGVGGEWSEIDADVLLGDALGLCAGMAWGATTVVVRGSRLSEAPAGLTLFYQLTVAFVLLLGYALAMVDLGQVRWTPLAIGSVLLQGIVQLPDGTLDFGDVCALGHAGLADLGHDGRDAAHRRHDVLHGLPGTVHQARAGLDARYRFMDQGLGLACGQ